MTRTVCALLSRVRPKPNTTMPTSGSISVHFPATVELASDAFVAEAPSASTGYSVTSQGTGSFTGLSYTVPAHAKGTLKARIQVLAITSEDVDNLNKLAMGMLDASAQSKVESYEKIHASANISIWSFFGGGAEASYDKTTSTMHSLGLTADQISTLMDAFLNVAQKMSHVELDFTIDNSANDYSVSGDLQLYTIAGEIKTAKGTAQYRLLADQGTAGNGTAPASGKVIPLS